MKYTSDLAYVHDRAFGNFAKEAATYILQVLKENNIYKGLVVDLGCGSGIVAQKLVDQGYDVFGIDYSQDFIAMCNERVPHGTFVCGSFFEIEIPSCAAVISIGECLNYLFDEKADEQSLASLEQLFHRVYDALTLNGLFIFDMLEPNIDNPRNYCKVIEREDWAMFYKVKEDQHTNILTRHMLLFRTIDDNCYHKTKEIHVQKLYSRDQLLPMLKKVGFEVKLIERYGALALGNYYVGFLCKKV